MVDNGAQENNPPWLDVERVFQIITRFSDKGVIYCCRPDRNGMDACREVCDVRYVIAIKILLYRSIVYSIMNMRCAECCIIKEVRENSSVPYTAAALGDGKEIEKLLFRTDAGFWAAEGCVRCPKEA